jgi:glucose/arabinose dehydrogenase
VHVRARRRDVPSTLYDAGGTRLCGPDDGFGGGEGRCPGFFERRSRGTLVWQDVPLSPTAAQAPRRARIIGRVCREDFLMRSMATCLCIALCGASVSAVAAVDDPAWNETVFSINRDAPDDTSSKQHTGLAWAPDGSDRLFVLEKSGRVRVLSGALTTASPTWSTFATMDPIYTNSECGLIGMAFDPDFASNAFVYFFVTVSDHEQQIIRYRARGTTGSARTVIRDRLPTAGANHDGGGIGFAADGKLYWSIGDLGNGSGVDADLTSLAAKVGRANRDGSAPSDNPFYDGVGPNNEYIFARGFRNPFTMQIQPSTGQIWLNVVGTGYEQVFVVERRGHGGYDDYENNQPAEYLTPKIVYRTNGVDTRNLTGAVRSGGVVTFTTVAPHGFRVGSHLTIDGVGDASFDQSDLYVASVPSPTTFTARQAGADASSSGGQATTLDQGGCLTGGAFYDATLAPSEYRGNFFYGDCNSGRIMRARIDEASNAVIGVDHWASGIPGQVDIAAGPDGALYYVGNFTNTVYRAAYEAGTQAIVVANRHLRIDEGGKVATSVRLARPPAAPVEVSVARSGGDADVAVLEPSALSFTPENWMRPQTVRFAAAPDADTVDDAATVTVSADGLAAETIDVTVLDLPVDPDLIFRDTFE